MSPTNTDLDVARLEVEVKALTHSIDEMKSEISDLYKRTERVMIDSAKMQARWAGGGVVIGFIANHGISWAFNYLG